MIRFSDIENRKPEEEPIPLKKPSLADAESVYNETVAFAKEAHQLFLERKELDTKDLCGAVEKLVNSASLPDDKIMFLTSNIYLEDYFYYHTVNVSILSIRMGLHLEYSRQQLVDLGVLALLHGMSGAEDESGGVGEFKKQKLIQWFIQGKQIKESFINDVSSIIAVIDVYESLTHSRQYRPRLMPYEILKAIISTGEEVFNPGIVKKAVELFSVYPLGSTVRLNTEEVAQVVRINRDFLLRPEVAIFIDSGGKTLKEKKSVDLAKHLNLYIKEPVL